MSEHTARLSIPVSFAVRCDSVTDLGSKEWAQVMSTTSGLSSILFAHQVDARAQGNERRAILNTIYNT